MKQKLRVFLTLLLCAVASVGWASETTYYFTSGKWAAVLGDHSTPSNWTSGKDGGFTSNQGVQVTTNNTGANATSPISFENVSKVTVEYCTNTSKGKGTILIQVGEGEAKSFSVSAPSSGGTTLKSTDFSFNPAESGNVKITVNCTTNSIYIHAITITYNDGSVPSPSLSVNPASLAFGEKAINSTYTETFTVTYANLTEDLSVRVGSGLTGVTVSPTTISKDATSPQTVTVTFAPTTVGSIDGEITVSNTDDNVSRNVAVTGSAYDPTDASSYVLYTDEIEEGDYVIYSSDGAMKNEVVSNRFANQSVIPENNKIVNPANTIVWHIAKNGEYWTIYNAAIGKYAAGTDTKNQGSLVDEVTDLAKWTITVSNGTWSFENYGRSEGSDPGNKYLRQNSTSGWACYGSGTGKSPMLYKFDDGTPSISADDVELAYDDTSGSIEYTIGNPVAGTSLTAEVTGGNEGNWLTLGEVGETSVPFTCSANETTEPRTATLTLTYDEVTKVVTVTQAAAPLIYTTIPDLLAAATSTSTPVTVTFGNWVVSGVNSNQLFVTDGTNGFIMYQSNHGFAVGNTLSGTVSCNLVLFNGSAEITGVTSETEGLTVGTNGSVTPVVTTIDALGAVNTGSVVTLNNLTYNGSVLSDETNEVTPYNSLYRDMSFEANRVYNVTGVFVMNNTTKRILPRSADDIEEVVDGREDPEIAFTPSTITITQDEQFDQPTFGNPNNVSVSFDTTNADVASWNNGLELGSSTGTATITATFGGNDSYLPATATLVVTVNEKGATSAMFDFDKDYATLFPSLNGGTSSSSSTAGDITEDLTATVDGVSLTVSAAESGTANRIWNGSPRLRMYSGTLTISAPANAVITELTISQGKWNSGNTADTGTLTSTNWTGNAQTVVITIAGNTQFKSIDVKYVPVETVTATISAAGYATFANEKAVDFSAAEGLTVLTAQYNKNTDKIDYTEVTSKKVPAGKAVVLKGAQGEYNGTVIATADELVNNGLKVDLTNNTPATGKEYCLARLNGVVGFYKVKVGVDVKAGKAYLEIERTGTTGGAKDFYAIEDETDGINAINNSHQTVESVYNLSGQRVNKAQKGIYIVNGKKIVVK